jgi:hypothetical protein
VPIYKKDVKADCRNYRGLSLLSVTYKISSNILLSRLIPYAEEINGDHQCGFQCNRLLIICSVFIKYLRKNENTIIQYTSYM